MKKKRLGFNIVILGMIASGKDTQANVLQKKYAIKLIETGGYARKLLKEKTKEGDLARRTMGKGYPLATSLLKKFLVQEIKNKPHNEDLLFLGGRLKPEAELIVKIFKKNKEKLLVFYITLPEKEVYKRSELRMRDADDAKYIKKRIAWHKDKVFKTVNYYDGLGILKRVNGNQSIKKVRDDIQKAIANFQKQIK